MLDTEVLLIIFHKVDGHIRKYESAKYLVLFRSDEIRYHIMLKSNISGEYSHKYTKIKTNTDHDLSLEKYIKYAKYSNID